jgi:hypothetical protein
MKLLKNQFHKKAEEKKYETTMVNLTNYYPG